MHALSNKETIKICIYKINHKIFSFMRRIVKKKNCIEINPEKQTSLFMRIIDIIPPPKLQRRDKILLQKYSKAICIVILYS